MALAVVVVQVVLDARAAAAAAAEAVTVLALMEPQGHPLLIPEAAVVVVQVVPWVVVRQGQRVVPQDREMVALAVQAGQRVRLVARRVARL